MNQDPDQKYGGGSLIEIVEQGCQDTNLEHGKDKLTKSIRFMDSLTQSVVHRPSNITPIAGFVKNHVERTVEEVRFEKALENQLSK